ncbi:MAG: heme ABC exporter ATP-binding protein CcmA [Nitrospinaceae bacterium]
MSGIHPSPAPEFVIEARGLRKQFGMLEALRGINLTLRQGEFLTIFGPNGAGKTTLIRIMASLTRPTTGSVRVAGFDVTDGNPALRREIGVISHATFLYADLTALENLVFFARIYSLREPESRALQALEGVELAARRHDKVRTFSRGMVQRVSIARALLHDPSILFLDEPYTGLDQHASLLLERHLRTLHTEKRTVVMTTHDFARGLELCDRVAIQVRGRFAYLQARPAGSPQAFERLYVETVEKAT